MPSSIEAVYFVADPLDEDVTKETSSRAYRAQRGLLEAFGEMPPLVRLSLHREYPPWFEIARCEVAWGETNAHCW